MIKDRIVKYYKKILEKLIYIFKSLMKLPKNVWGFIKTPKQSLLKISNVLFQLLKKLLKIPSKTLKFIINPRQSFRDFKRIIKNPQKALKYSLISIIVLLIFTYTFKDSLLYRAASSGNLFAVKILVKMGADVDYKKNGRPTLYAARENVKTLEFLLKNNADSNIDYNGGYPLLFCLIDRKDSDAYRACRLLIESGADVTPLVSYNQTLLHIAVDTDHDNERNIDLVLDNGIDINTKDSFGRTPLNFAAREGRTENVKILLDKGADVNSVDRNGNTPLYNAIIEKNKEIVKILIKHDASVLKENNDGKDAMALAKWSLSSIRKMIRKKVEEDKREVARVNKALRDAAEASKYIESASANGCEARIIKFEKGGFFDRPGVVVSYKNRNSYSVNICFRYYYWNVFKQKYTKDIECKKVRGGDRGTVNFAMGSLWYTGGGKKQGYRLFIDD